MLYTFSIDWHECTKFRYITCITPTGLRQDKKVTKMAEYGDPHSDHRDIGAIKNHGGADNHRQHKHNRRKRNKLLKRLARKGGI